MLEAPDLAPPTLFVLSKLPRARVSVRGIGEGEEPLSGTLASCLLVVEELARRGRRVGVLLIGHGELTGVTARVFHDQAEALTWANALGDPVVIWCSWGEREGLRRINEAGVQPIVWLHTHIDREVHEALLSGRVSGLVTVSDLARLTFLHSPRHARIGRVYNSLNPFFEAGPEGETGRYDSQRVVFTGYLGESKGAHRVLRAWAGVRERLPRATLTIIGSARLYGDDRGVGPMGVASPEFERLHLAPFLERYGSLEAGGVRLAGLLSPREIRDTYRGAALGVVNLNWSEDTETFCCTAVEMLATGLPVLGAARGSLPETVGASGGASLVEVPDLGAVADRIAGLLRDPERLAELGRSGRRFARSRYEVGRVVDRWEVLLAAGAGGLDRASGPWESTGRMTRYYLERSAAAFGMGWAFDRAKSLAVRILGRGEPSAD